MVFSVYLTDDASADLEDLYEYIETHTVDGRADRVLEKIELAFSRLSIEPERGSFPKELLPLGIREFRELNLKPYRIIYRIIKSNVNILLIADGRRDMQALLQKRLLHI